MSKTSQSILVLRGAIRLTALLAVNCMAGHCGQSNRSAFLITGVGDHRLCPTQFQKANRNLTGKGERVRELIVLNQAMEPSIFFEKLKQNQRPVIVDFWAPWCGPCMAVKPALEKLSQEYSGRVDLWQINADENQELLRHLKVYGIPTLAAYRQDEEQVRFVGAKSQGQLRSLFEAVATGTVPVRNGLSTWDRIFRLAAGSLVAGAGWILFSSWVLVGAGAILIFSGMYDRCPVWKAITAEFKKVMAK